MARNENVLNV
ncbi:hypothetical protein GQ600_1268 [Phytophthora cactorum]|nr:hypothetical protein GQ600_1268 [Phytophthora cactorum]